MTPERYRRAKGLFLEASELPKNERSAFVDRAVGDDAEMRSIVEDLIRNDDDPHGFVAADLEGGGARLLAAGIASDDSSFDETQQSAASIPATIGGYRIIRKVGEGGMGVVYEARQDSPRRLVALKVMKQALDSPSLRRRFEFEVQVLGRLQHPGIAQIFEAGTTDPQSFGESPRPFFAMEKVDGKPLVAYADTRQLGTCGRLELLIAVCEAVQHAHAHGVIHRDLKPDNILVNEAGQPKILDFGIARATDSDVQATTLRTDLGQLIGTIPYMSPEQVRGDPAQVDTRSDVYALGVVAYELLSGRLPYDLRGKTVPEAVRVISEDDPTPLSSISRVLQGDVQTIVAKALDKDRDRRYQSALDLAADVRRYLRGEAIDARRDSGWYVLRKTVARYRVAVTVVTAFVLLVTASSVALAFLYRDQSRARARAEQEASKAAAVTGVLQDMLASVNPDFAQGEEITVRRVLDETAREIESGSLSDQPEVEAAVRVTIGETYRALGRYEDAETHLHAAMTLTRRLLGDHHPELATICNSVGVLRYDQGDYDGAEKLIREALRIWRGTLGREHPEAVDCLNNLASVFYEKGDFAQAESLLREVIAIRRTLHTEADADLATNMCNLASVLGQTGSDSAEVEALYREALAINRKALGDDHPATAYVLNNLAHLLQSKGELAEAAELFSDALALRRKVLGNDHPDLAGSLNNLAALLRAMGDYARAAPLAREGLAIRRKNLPPAHPHTARSLLLLGLLLFEQGQVADAEPLFRECVGIRRTALPEGHHLTAEAESVLGGCLTMLGRYDDAEPLLVESYPRIRQGRGESHPRTLQALGRLVDLYDAWGKPTQAAEWRATLPEN